MPSAAGSSATAEAELERDARTDARRLVKGSTLLFASLMVGNALNVAYTFLMARLLSPAEYASLIALLSLFIVVGLPSGTIQTVVVRFVAIADAATDQRRIREIVTGLLWRLVPVAATATVAVVLAAGPLAAFLQLERVTPLMLIAPLFGMTLLLPVLRGALQGVQRFGVLAILGLIDIGFKVLLGVGLVWLGFGVSGAIVAMLVGMLVGLLLSGLPLLATVRGGRERSTSVSPGHLPAGQGLGDLWRFSLPTLFTLGGLYSMVTLDAVLVKHYFAAEVAGLYAVLSVTGRSFFWLSSAVTLVLLPVVAHRSSRAQSERATGGTFWWSVGLVALLSLTGEAVFYLAPTQVIGLLFGVRYGEAASLLALYGWSAVCLALANVALHYLLAQGRKITGVVAPLCAAGQITLVTRFHADIHQVVAALVVANAALLVTSLALVVRPLRPRAHGDGTAAESERRTP